MDASKQTAHPSYFLGTTFLTWAGRATYLQGRSLFCFAVRRDSDKIAVSVNVDECFSAAREGIGVERQLDAGFRFDLYMAARTIRR